MLTERDKNSIASHNEACFKTWGNNMKEHEAKAFFILGQGSGKLLMYTLPGVEKAALVKSLKDVIDALNNPDFKMEKLNVG